MAEPAPIAPPEPKKQEQSQPQQQIKHDISQPWYGYGMSTVGGTEQGDLNNAVTRYLADARNYWTWQRDEQAGQRGFWENPYRVARYHNVIQAAPPGWQAPDWLNVKGVEEAYKWFEQRNDGKPWYQWRPLPDDDPAIPFLRGDQMQVPPDEYLWGGEEYFKQPRYDIYKQQQAQQQARMLTDPTKIEQYAPEVGAGEYADRAEILADPYKAMGYTAKSWKEMPTWAKVYLSITSSQPMQDRPKLSQLTGAIIPSAPGLQGAAGIGALIGASIGSVIPGAGTALGGAAGAVLLPTMLLGETIYETYTGDQIPGPSDMFGVFDLGAELTERVLNMPSAIVAEAGGKLTAPELLRILTDPSLVSTLFKSGHYSYETAGNNPLLMGAGAIDLARNAQDMIKQNVGIADLISGSYDWQKTPDNYTWKLTSGYDEPVPILSQNRTTPMRGDIQQEIIGRLKDGEDMNIIYADILDRYGDVGTMNEFAGHLLYDPINFTSIVGNKLGEVGAEKIGNQRLAAEFRAGQGNILIDALPPGVQQLAEKITKVKGSQSPLSVIGTFKAAVESNVWADGTKPGGEIPAAKDLHWLDKAVLGLDDNGEYKKLKPYEPQEGKSKLSNFYNYMQTMNPESQAIGFMDMFMENMGVLALEADDPNLDNTQKAKLVIDLYKQYGSVSPVEAGQAGEAILKSPLTSSTAVALRGMLKSGVMDEMLAQWSADQPRIAMLENMAKLMGIDSATLIERIGKDTKDTLLALVDIVKTSDDPNAKQILTDYQNRVLTPETLRSQFEIFMDKNSHPFKFEDWRTRVVMAAHDMAKDFLLEHYAIKDLGTVNRMFSIMKSIQSSLLLDYNPAYFTNNVVNNWATRAVEGVFGVLTPSQIDQFNKRFGIDVIETVKDAELGNKIRDIQLGEGKLAQAAKDLQKFRNKFGIFNRMSHGVEQSERNQAKVIGMKRAWDSVWKPGVGFDKLPGALEVQLKQIHPDLPNFIYSNIRSGMNMDEIYKGIYADAVQVNVSRALDNAANKLFPDNPGIARDVFKTLGLDDALQNQLSKSKTVQDVDRAFDSFGDKMQEILDKKTASDILDVEGDTIEKVKSQGVAGAVKMFSDMIHALSDHWVSHFNGVEEMLDKLEKGNADWEQRNKAWSDLNNREAKSWKRINDFELQVTSGILKVLGIDNAAGIKFLDSTGKVLEGWRDFYEGYDVHIVTGERVDPMRVAEERLMTRHVPGRNDMWREYFATDWNNQPNGSAKATADAIKQKLAEMYKVHTDNEAKMQGEIDQLFADMFAEHTGRPAQEALQWRQRVWAIRQQMIDKMMQFRTDLMNGEATKTWKEFLDEDYKPLMAEMSKAEIIGSQEVMRGNETIRPVEAKPVTPEEAVRAHAEAEELLKAADASKQDAQTKVDAILNRDTLLKQMRDEFALSKDEYAAVRLVMDLHAEQWAQHTGGTIDQWYSSKLAGFGGEGDVDFRQAINTPEFRNWFGDSKVVDDAGQPLVVYHGTDKDITIFETGKTRHSKYFGDGVYFTDADYQASGYAGEGAGANVILVYLSLKNPFIEGVSDFNGGKPLVATSLRPDLITKKYIDAGYDGIVLQRGWFVAFSPEQIKSVNNRGTFDPNNPNILMQNKSVLDLARDYGIVTATKSGQPNNKYILNIVNKYGTTKVNGIEEVTPELAKQAFEARRAEKGLPTLSDDAKGGVKFLDDGRAVIRAFKGADVSTVVHELGHVFRRDLFGDDLEAVAQWGGYKTAQDMLDAQTRFDAGKLSDADMTRYREAEEKFARGWERYLTEDNDAIPPKMQSVFKKFTQWMLSIYKKISGSEIDIDINAQFEVNGQTIRIKDVMDRMLFDEGKLRQRNDKANILVNRPTGKATTASGANPNIGYSFRYKLVDLDELVVSHDKNFNLNPMYPKELQPRLRDRAASQTQVNRIAQDLNPEALLRDTGQLDRGIPIIGNDMVMESGNGRTLALRQAMDAYPDKYAEYTSELASRLPDYGFTEQDMQGLNHPVLVRERVDNVDRIEFVKEANQTAVLRMSPLEQALQDADAVNDMMLSTLTVGDNQTIDQALQTFDNINVLRTFVETLPPNERAAVVDAQGNLNSEGLNRLKNALFAKTYPGEAGQRLLKLFSESINPVVRNVENAMFASLAKMAQAEGAIRSGLRSENLSIVDDIARVTDIYARLKQNKMSVADYLSQQSIFEQELNPFQQQMLAYIAENGRRPKALRELLNNYANAIMQQPDPRQMILFAGEPLPEKGEIFDVITRAIQPEEEGLFAETTGEAIAEANRAGTEATAEVEATTPPAIRNKLEGVVNTRAGDARILGTDENGNTTYEINGETKSTGELFQSAQRDATNTPEFRNWFGDSKVVDDAGQPLVVYHGTQNKFDIFSLDHMRTNGTSEGVGFYFTDAKDFAETYTRGTGNLMPVYLSIKNPMDVNQKKITKQQLRKILLKVHELAEQTEQPGLSNYGDISYDGLNKVLNTAVNLEWDGHESDLDLISSIGNGGTIYPADLNKIVTDVTGYDGVIVDRNTEKFYVVFNPEQIKSVNNRGTFDPNNPNILYQTPAIGKASDGQSPEILWQSRVMDEGARETIEPMLDQMREEAKNQLRYQQPKIADLPEDAVMGLKSYLNKVKSQMPSSKLATMRRAEQIMNGALLNYSERYPIDTMLETVFPYQFWYTRSMMNWAMRTIDKPQLFSMYAKFRNFQHNSERKGIPSRLRDKIKMSAPYLPDWAGGATYFDPLKQIFPPSQFLQPFDDMAVQQSAINQQAIEILRTYAEDGDITQKQLKEALDSRDGELWQSALRKAKAEREEGVGNPFNLVTLMMSPALWLTAPYNMAKGTPEKISPMPLTRTSGAVETMLEDTPLDAVGKLVGLASRPEQWLRKQAGISTYGEYGDYYIERQLSNMAAEGANVDEVRRAMIDKQGELYDKAEERVKLEQALRVPGALPIQALKGGGDVADVGGALLFGVFPQSLFPEGELKYRGLQDEFYDAAKRYSTGDSTAFRKFFDEHPEYEARMALFKDPEERMRSFLIGKIWDGYMELSGPNKQIANEKFGEQFGTNFLSKTTQDYTSIDTDTLAGWAQAIGAVIPQTANVTPPEAQALELMPKAAADIIQQYWDARNKKFPNWNKLQQGYFSSGSNPAYLQRFLELKEYWNWKQQYESSNQVVRTYNQILRDQYNQSDGSQQEEEVKIIDQFPQDEADKVRSYWKDRDETFPNWRAIQEGYYAGGRSKAYLAKFPELKEYWDWKRAYEKKVPAIKAYNDASKQFYAENPSFGSSRSQKENTAQSVSQGDILALDDTLLRQLMEYYMTGNSITNGARKELYRQWEMQGRPGGYFDDYIDEVLKGAIMP